MECFSSEETKILISLLLLLLCSFRYLLSTLLLKLYRSGINVSRAFRAYPVIIFEISVV